MGILNRLFANKPEKLLHWNLDQFGRFSDTYKLPEDYEAWDKSVDAFDNQEFQKSFLFFADYLRNPQKNNIQWQATKMPLHFRMLQGSRIIDAKLVNGTVQISCLIAKADELQIGFMRRLLDLNYELKYVRYGLTDQNELILLFDSPESDASPYKLYYAIKELAIHADKQDDLLVDEFNFLYPLLADILMPMTDQEKTIKYQYFKKLYLAAFELLDKGKLKTEQYPSAAAYILLALTYKIDYLIGPEGAIMDKIEGIHKNYFSQDNKNIQLKLKIARTEISKLSQVTEADFKKNLYHTISTFGITSPANHSIITDLIHRELPNMLWYQENNYPEYAISVAEYIIGFCFFNYALPLPIRDLFHLVYRISCPDFFDLLEGNAGLANGLNKPDKPKVKSELIRILKSHKTEFPYLSLDLTNLPMESSLSLIYAILSQIKSLDLSKAK